MVPPALAAVACALASVGVAECGSSSVSSVTSPNGRGSARVPSGRQLPRRAGSPSCAGIGARRRECGLRVGENPDPVPRQGTLVVSDGSVELSQAAAPCAFTLGSNTDVVSTEGGTLSIDVRTNAACSWTASTYAPWATPSPESGKERQTRRPRSDSPPSS